MSFRGRSTISSILMPFRFARGGDRRAAAIILYSWPEGLAVHSSPTFKSLTSWTRWREGRRLTNKQTSRSLADNSSASLCFLPNINYAWLREGSDLLRSIINMQFLSMNSAERLTRPRPKDEQLNLLDAGDSLVSSRPLLAAEARRRREKGPPQRLN